MREVFTEGMIDFINEEYKKLKRKIIKSILIVSPDLDFDELFDNHNVNQLRLIDMYLRLGFSFKQAENISMMGLYPKEFNKIVRMAEKNE